MEKSREIMKAGLSHNIFISQGAPKMSDCKKCIHHNEISSQHICAECHPLGAQNFEEKNPVTSHIISTPTVLYDVSYCESQDHPSIQCRVKAFDVDQVVEYVKARFSAYEYTDELGDEECLYLTVNPCAYCELEEEYKENNENCDNCEVSAYMELKLLENEEESLKLMFDPAGNFRVYESFIDLTVEEETI